MTLKDLCLQCKALRVYLQYKQQEVADDCGVTQSAISRFESGQNDSARILCWYLIHGQEVNEEVK